LSSDFRPVFLFFQMLDAVPDFLEICLPTTMFTAASG
jgi:hypothetical protein